MCLAMPHLAHRSLREGVEGSKGFGCRCNGRFDNRGVPCSPRLGTGCFGRYTTCQRYVLGNHPVDLLCTPHVVSTRVHGPRGVECDACGRVNARVGHNGGTGRHGHVAKLMCGSTPGSHGLHGPRIHRQFDVRECYWRVQLCSRLPDSDVSDQGSLWVEVPPGNIGARGGAQRGGGLHERQPFLPMEWHHGYHGRLLLVLHQVDR
mmetsp:Transcript_113795/g.197754  ORF Transcript_113795/g.197754 Transcript_113795/m.197754 type:complete len:205 (-) Transcript_113795:1670-2284(-)